jgi:hypothetical protein
MGVILVAGQHGRITAKELKQICDCWKMPGKGACEHDGCFLARERVWRSWTDTEQAENERKRADHAKKVVAAFKGAWEIATKMEKEIREIEFSQKHFR